MASDEIEYQEPHVIAEIGCNHMGKFEVAKELLTLAKQSGATVGKFQKRCPKELLTKEQYEAPHPNPHNSYGDTYGAHREFLELDVEQRRAPRHITLHVAFEMPAWVRPNASSKV